MVGMNGVINFVLVFGTLFASWLALGASLTYPECTSSGSDSGCCAFGEGSMANRGYIVLQLDDYPVIVTCSKGTLACHKGNPEQQAYEDSRENISCSAVTSLLESRSTLTYLDGVKDSTPTPSTSEEDDEDSPGTVTAADSE